MRLSYCLLLFLCSTYGFSQDFNYQSLIIDKTLTENADAVVRLDQMTVNVLAQDKMTITSTRVVTVLNKNGNKHIHGYVGYNNSRKVNYIKAVVYDALGNEIKKIKEKDFKDVSAVSGGTLYSDYRVKYLDYTPTQYPYTIVLNKEIETKNTAYIPTWNFLDGYSVSTEKSHFSVHYAASSLKPEVFEKNITNFDITLEEEPLSFDYTAINIAAVKSEQLSPSFSEITPKVMMRLTDFHYEGYNAHVENWEQLGKWFYDTILKGRDGLPEPIKQHVLNLVKDAESDKEKAKIVYEYMQGVTRYISVQVGIGGVQPIVASEVDRVKYGDCKGLSNYTRSLLDVVGVKSYYVHVEAGNNKIDFENDFPSLAQGNHAILAIPNEEGYTWIDCTSQVHPFGFLGDFTDDRKVLVIKPDGGEVVKTTAYLEKENAQKIEAEIQLLVDGSLKANAVIETKGVQYDNRFKLEDYDKDKVVKYYQGNWSEINNLVLQNYSFVNKKDEVKFTEKVTISAVNYARILGDRILFSPNVLNKNTNVPKRYRSRKLPFRITRGYLDTDSFTVSLPEGYSVEALPESKEVKTEFGVYSISIVEKGGVLQYNRKLLLNAGSYPAEKYSAYRNFRKEVSKNDASQVSLLKK